MSFWLVILAVLVQAPPAIQIFMPGGTLPPRPMRLTLTRDDGRIEVVFTDTKGKFQVTGDLIRSGRGVRLLRSFSTSS
jgi:hypothetical protein